MSLRATHSRTRICNRNIQQVTPDVWSRCHAAQNITHQAAESGATACISFRLLSNGTMFSSSKSNVTSSCKNTSGLIVPFLNTPFTTELCGFRLRGHFEKFVQPVRQMKRKPPTPWRNWSTCSTRSATVENWLRTDFKQILVVNTTNFLRFFFFFSPPLCS